MAIITIQYDGKTIVCGDNNSAIPPVQYEVEPLNKKNKVVQVRNSKIYIPMYKEDFIQGCVSVGAYYETDFLEETRKYLPTKPVILDIGANIGNHTLFWANECSAKKIYAFEPVPFIFKILKKNIKINNLQERVKIYNVGLSDKKSAGKITSFDRTNIGGTRLEEAKDEDAKDNIKLVTLDSIDFDEKRIDLIKIDVEGMDYLVLTGAIKTIKKYKPLILIESFPYEYNISSRILMALGYKIIKDFGSFEYLYAYEG